MLPSQGTVGRAIGNSMDEEEEAERRRREANEQQRLREENERRQREEEMRKRPYNELELLRRDYPHAFVAICNECLGGVIYDSSINMPGERKSMRQKRHADSYPSTHFSVTMSIYDTRKYYNKQYRPIGVDAYGQYPRDSVYGRMNSTARYYQEPKTVWALLPEDVNKILAQKSKFSGRERSILATLKSEVQWEGEQAEYARKSRSSSLKGYGCYSYDIEFKRITKDGKEKIGEYKVGQHFISSYFLMSFLNLLGN